jgi:hypothetical protein
MLLSGCVWSSKVEFYEQGMQASKQATHLRLHPHLLHDAGQGALTHTYWVPLTATVQHLGPAQSSDAHAPPRPLTTEGGVKGAEGPASPCQNQTTLVFRDQIADLNEEKGGGRGRGPSSRLGKVVQ